jgi:hypothetical protein
VQDFSKWLVDEAPASGHVHIIVAAIHAYAEYRLLKATGNLREIAAKTGKTFGFTIWRAATLQDKRTAMWNSDVLRPRGPIDHPLVVSYLEELSREVEERRAEGKTAYGVEWRTADGIGASGLFSSTAARTRYEEQMLIAGCRVKEMCKNLPRHVRPLGVSNFVSLGFGSLLVTHRNCPNNCPIAWWVDEPWRALLPRRTNSTTALARMFDPI